MFVDFSPNSTAVLSYSFPLLSLDMCLSLSKEMVECSSFGITQILSVLYPSSLELLPEANFYPKSLFLLGVT